jgi:hypothetical protein
MSFSRLNYDSCSYKQVLFESVGPGNYQLGTPPISCDYCYPMPPTVRMQGTGVSIDRSVPLVDQHSELLNITRKASKCCEKKWKQGCNHCGWLSLDKYPNCQPNSVCPKCNSHTESKPVKKYNPVNSRKLHKINESFCGSQQCGEKKKNSNVKHFKPCFPPQKSSRLDDAPCTLRGTGIDRFSSEVVFECPQSNVFVPFDYNINNRIIAKDNHRPCVPNPVDQTLPLPPTSLSLPCEKIKPTCGNFAWGSKV